MANQTQLEILRLGVDTWNEWYQQQLGRPADFAGASMRCENLAGVNFAKAVLRQADLRYANLRGADLRGADLDGAMMERADLRGARLEGSRGLTGEQLLNADGDATTRLPWTLKPPRHWQPDSEGSLGSQPILMPGSEIRFF